VIYSGGKPLVLELSVAEETARRAKVGREGGEGEGGGRWVIRTDCLNYRHAGGEGESARAVGGLAFPRPGIDLQRV